VEAAKLCFAYWKREKKQDVPFHNFGFANTWLADMRLMGLWKEDVWSSVKSSRANGELFAKVIFILFSCIPTRISYEI